MQDATAGQELLNKLQRSLASAEQKVKKIKEQIDLLEQYVTYGE